MLAIQGIGISSGIAIGPVFHYALQSLEVTDYKVQDTIAERQRLDAALQAARDELQEILTRAGQQGVGASEMEIFEAHILILEDPELLDQVHAKIENDSQNASYAWRQGTEFYAEMLAAMQNEYFAARAADVRDVAGRVLRILSGKQQANTQLEQPSVVVAQELTPSDTVTFDRGKVLAFCTNRGGPTSHVAILSKALGIPAITGLGPYLEKLVRCSQMIVDGGSGKVILEPDEPTRQAYLTLKNEQQSRFAQALVRAHEPAITQDGQAVEVVANIGAIADAETALSFGAEGVGLLRTEFLFLDREVAPTEDEQFETYRPILQAFGSHLVVIRTLDIGGDKPASYMPIQNELNPFLGVRGARLGLVYTDVLETQLRALLRAGLGHNLKIMFPMISTLAEIQAVRQHVEKAQVRLEAQGLEYNRHAEIGIMVEVPSAALMADVLAPAVDFFSIGTNDLSQYTLAADRTNQNVAGLADALEPSVLRLIGMVTKAAHQHGIWVGLCGELAGDPLAAPVLLGLEVDELSMNPRSIPVVKEALRHCRREEYRQVTEHVLQLSGAAQVRSYLQGLSS